MSDKPHLLFLCTGNACRSQMAEGFARHLWSELFTVSSAGLVRHGLNPLAVRAMSEVAIDISHHHSQSLDEFDAAEFDIVITVCGHAEESCPAFVGDVKRFHVGFDDPPKLAADAASDEQAMPHYRRVRDEIRAFMETLPEQLGSATA